MADPQKTARNQKRYQKPCVKIVKYCELLIHTQKYIQRQKKWKSKSLFSSNWKNRRLIKQCVKYMLVHSGWIWGGGWRWLPRAAITHYHEADDSDTTHSPPALEASTLPSPCRQGCAPLQAQGHLSLPLPASAMAASLGLCLHHHVAYFPVCLLWVCPNCPLLCVVRTPVIAFRVRANPSSRTSS